MASNKKQEIQQLLAVAAAACEDKKAEDIRILALDPSESGLTDYFLICTGMSDRQNVAITDEVEIRLKRDHGVTPNSVEGRRQGEWILMDYVDFIVHVFSVEKRAFYGLERLRKSATALSVDDLNAEIKAAITAGRRKTQPSEDKKPAAAAKKSASPKDKTSVKVKKSAGKEARTPGAQSQAVAAKKSAAKKSPAKKLPAKKSSANKSAKASKVS